MKSTTHNTIQRIKMLMLTATQAVACVGFSAQNEQRSFFNKNPNAIEESSPAPIQHEVANLDPGLYYVEDEARGRGWSHFMLLDSFVNDSSKLIGFILSRNALENGNQATLQIIQAIPLQHGTTLLSPLFINSAGIPAIEAEQSNGDAPVMEVSLDSSRPNRDHFNIIGHNGALKGRSLRMKKVRNNRPAFSGWPSSGLFNSETTNGTLVVQNSLVTLNQPNQESRTYKISALNNENGRIAGLQEAKFDSRRRSYIVDSLYSKFAFFLKDQNGQEVFVIANQTHNPTEFLANFYCPKKRNLFQIIADFLNSSN